MTADKRMVDVGEGILDFAELFSHIDTAGFKHYFVEHDRPDVALESIAVSIKAVKSLVF